MATLRTINKQVGTPLEVAAVIRRLATPAIIQPTYTFDVSDLGWYMFDGIDTYERVLNNQYVSLYGTNGITVHPPTKTGNIIWQEISGLGVGGGSGITDASFSNDFTWAGGLLYADVSVIAGGVSKAYVDGSIATINANMSTYIKSASTGTGLFWNNSTHKVDVSIATVTTLAKLTDVSINSPANLNVLSYDTSISKWKNRAPANADLLYQEILPSGTKTSGSTGVAGQWSYDSTNLYICVGTNSWKKLTLSTI